MTTKQILINIAAIAVLTLAVFFLVAASGCASREIGIGDLPPAVRDTLERETTGGRILDIERIAKKGKVTYTADAEIGGKDYDITIDEDGKLISKELER